ncbi:MAG: GNAT family N-acetyltransferase [Pseudomonadota bacterium]
MAKNKNTTIQTGKLKLLSAHVTHMEMDRPHGYAIPVPTRPALALMKASNIPPHYYRYLYELVGKPHHWQDRRNLSSEELDAIINSSDCEVHVLYADGCPAGFFEYDLQKMPECIEIEYFGLGTDFQGLGFGKWFLSAAISNAWSLKPGKIAVSTNTLDHPAALPLYQKLGFSPVGVSDEEITPWV